MELSAVGIGHDVTRYYRRIVTISDSEQHGHVMLKQLAVAVQVARRFYGLLGEFLHFLAYLRQFFRRSF